MVTTSPAHVELVGLAGSCITRHHAHHYLGFAGTQWQLFVRTSELKPLLYTERVLLTGVHLMRTGVVEAHLPTLLDLVPEAPPWVPLVMEHKAEAEHAPIGDLLSSQTAEAAVCRLTELLESERDRTSLPDAPTAEPALHDLVVRCRLGSPVLSYAATRGARM